MELRYYICLLLFSSFLLSGALKRSKQLKRKFNSEILQLKSEIQVLKDDFHRNHSFSKQEVLTELMNEVIPKLLRSMQLSGMAEDIAELTKSETDLKIQRLENLMQEMSARLLETHNDNQVLNERISSVTCTCNDSRNETESDSMINIAEVTGRTTIKDSTWLSFAVVRKESRRHPWLLAIGKGDNGFVRFRLKNNRKRNYPLETRNVNSLAFDVSSDSIVWSNGSTVSTGAGIFSMPFTGGVIKELRMSDVSWGMAIDQEKSLIFFTTSAPRRTVSVMSTSGSDFRVVTNLEDVVGAYSVALEPTNETLYVCLWNRIVKMSYEGTEMSIIARGTMIHSAAVDTKRLFLYYNNANMVVRMSLITGSTVTISRLDSVPWKFVYFDNKLYIGSWNGVTVDVVDTKLKTFSSIGNVGLGLIAICIVP